MSTSENKTITTPSPTTTTIHQVGNGENSGGPTTMTMFGIILATIAVIEYLLITIKLNNQIPIEFNLMNTSNDIYEFISKQLTSEQIQYHIILTIVNVLFTVPVIAILLTLFWTKFNINRPYVGFMCIGLHLLISIVEKLIILIILFEINFKLIAVLPYVIKSNLLITLSVILFTIILSTLDNNNKVKKD